jgi:hypothetical protein
MTLIASYRLHQEKRSLHSFRQWAHYAKQRQGSDPATQKAKIVIKIMNAANGPAIGKIASNLPSHTE